MSSDLTITLSSGSGLNEIGLVEGALVGRSLEEYLGDTPAGAESLAAHRRALEGRAVVYTMRWEGRDLLIRLEPEAGPQGTVTAVVGVSVDITEAASAVESLREHAVAAEELADHRRVLIAEVIKARDEERQWIVRELHDEIGALLTSASFGAKRLALELTGPQAERAAGLTTVLEESLRRTRTLLHRIAMPEIRDMGLGRMVRQMSARLTKVHGTTIDVDVTTAPGGVASEIALALYRVAQEALTNVIRHANASRASVLVARSADAVRMVIEDDGVGFDPESAAGGIGLAGIRDRIAALRGSVEITSGSNGTTIVVTVPLADSPATPAEATSGGGSR